MDPNSRDALNRWRAVVDLEAHLREQISWGMANGPRPSQDESEKFNWQPKEGIEPTSQQLREWWGAVEGVWREYSRQIAAGFVPEPPPAELAGVMAGLCGFLAVGRLPGPMKDAVAEGRSKPVPPERRDIELAVAYHRAATTGLEHNECRITIEDDTPIKTVSNFYGVMPGAVRNWVRKHSPAFLGVTDVDSETLKGLVETAGKRYRIAGRSQRAIAARATKRKRRSSRN